MAVKLHLLFNFLLLILCLAMQQNSNISAEAGHAHSFQHFHGPVHGDDKEVMWLDKHGKQHRDYEAPAHYEFAYGVQDHHTGDYHGQKEQRDGKAVAGEYTVKEPDGNIRTVKYHADEDGFHAVVHNSRGNDRQNTVGGGGGSGSGTSYDDES
ncbi:hypothetical protein QAD02_008670 [Eretmocerus hayati]|uniref:Uncharacterized protein n=1 Tax=Eretmocerus hayati TaxID=131215 RepID=A0ACC2N8E4_9HYME|nr:hypothetical protein QAD02_008670 [Eretmocerus hayati]